MPSGGFQPEADRHGLFVRIQVGKNPLKRNKNAKHYMPHNFVDRVLQIRRKFDVLNELHLLQKLVNGGVN